MISYLLAIGTLGMVYALLALALNFQWGYTGLINFGVAGFFAIGAYTTAILTGHGWPVLPAVIAAVLVGVLLGFPIALLSVRLRDDYLAITTLGFSEVVRLLAVNEGWLTNGTNGISNIPQLFPGMVNATYAWVVFCVLAVIVLATYLLLERLGRSPFGRTLEAIREDETAVMAIGKSPTNFKTRSFVIGTGIIGLAGALYAHYINYVSPEQFLPLVTFYVWMALILGGAGSNLGALAGSFVLVVFLEGSRFLKDLFPMIDEPRLAAARYIVVGLALILLILYRPNGIFIRRRQT